MVWWSVQVFWGWAEVPRCGGPGPWNADVPGAVLADVGGDRCGRPAAAGAGDREAGRAEDRVAVAVGQDRSSPNGTPPHPL